MPQAANVAYVTALIQRAASRAGSEYALAKTLGVPQSHLSEWKGGRRNCVPEDRARLAALAGEDAVQELVRATLEKTEGTLRGNQLSKVLGKLSQAITGGQGFASLVAISLTSGAIEAGNHFIRCIEVLTRRHPSPESV